MFSQKQYIIIEILSYSSFIPVFKRIKETVATNTSLHVFFIDGKPLLVKLLSRLLSQHGGVCEKLEFRLIDLVAEDGNLRYLKTHYEDMMDIQKIIIKDLNERGISDSINEEVYLNQFLSKQALLSNQFSPYGLIRAFHIIQAALWKISQLAQTDLPIIIIGRQRHRSDLIRLYAQRHGILYIECFVLNLPLEIVIKKCIKNVSLFLINTFNFDFKQRQEGKTKLLVDYYGHLYLDDQKMFSDLFFYQQSDIKGENILVSFNLPSDPLTPERMKSLNQHHITPVVLNPRAAKGVSVAKYFEKKRVRKVKWSGSLLDDSLPNSRWIKDNIKHYMKEVDYWERFFKKYQVKLHTSWYKYDQQHMMIADAIRRVGGIDSIYQRAFEEFPAPKTCLGTDIVFGFSADRAYKESESTSSFKYHVATGWLGDHRFKLLKPEAEKIRAKLTANGAKHILAYFDEGSAADDRWQTGHSHMRENYQFILEKVLSNRNIGLVIKPKVPKTLSARLGTVAPLLEKAQQTGRCLVLSEGVIVGSYPPAMAALAADITIHGHFAAATAGIEAILAGQRTVMYDGEHWQKSLLFDSMIDKAVFRDWNKLWASCEQFIQDPQSMEEFGRWDEHLDYFDPFRDGKAAYRMGIFLQWLLEGFENGLDREQNMIRAVERYRKIWGGDKVVGMKEEGEGMISSIIFDFDGVLAESVDIKTDAFRELFKEYPNLVDQLVEYHEYHGGVSRVEKIKYFYSELLKEDVDNKIIEDKCQQFSDLVVEKVVASESVKGADELLKKGLKKWDMFVVSGTPEPEIREIVKRRGMDKYFKEVFGSPAKKKDLIKQILNEYEIAPSHAVCIGDAITDFEGAKANKIKFIACVKDTNLDWLNDSAIDACVNNLTGVADLIERM